MRYPFIFSPKIAKIYQCHAGVAQLFRARPCQGRGPELESLYPHHEIMKRDRRGLFLLSQFLTKYINRSGCKYEQ